MSTVEQFIWVNLYSLDLSSNQMLRTLENLTLNSMLYSLLSYCFKDFKVAFNAPLNLISALI